MRSSSWLLILAVAFVACSDDEKKTPADEDDGDDDVARSLIIAQTAPAADATNVPVGVTAIVVTFSEGLDAATVPSTLDVTVGESAFAVAPVVTGSNLTVTVTTATYATPCALVIPAGVRSSLGAELSDDFSLAFVTAPAPAVEAVSLASGGGIATSTPQPGHRYIGLADSGEMFAMWEAASSSISTSRRPAGASAWGLATQTNTGSSPTVAVAANGAAMVLANRFIAGSEWRNFTRRLGTGASGLVQQVSTYGTTDDVGDVVMHANGNATLAFAARSGADSRSVRLLRHNGTGWSAGAETIEGDRVVAQGPLVATDTAGNVWVTWSGFAAGVSDVRTAYCFSGGACGMTTTLDTSAENATLQDVAMSGQGVAIAVWTEGEAAAGRLWTSYATASTWSTPAPLGEPGNLVGTARVAVCGSGSAFAVWTQTDTALDRDDIWVARFANGAFATPVRLETSLFDAREPRVACDGAGNATVAWIQEADGAASIYTNRYSGGTWRGPTLAEDHAAIVEAIDLATNPMGQVMLWWTEQTGGARSVWAASVQ